MEVLNEIEHVFEASRDIENAFAMEKYMRNIFPFLGIKSPERRELSKPFLKKYSPNEKSDLIKLLGLLWEKEEREYQHFAMDLAFKNYHLLSDEIEDGIVKKMIIEKSWWDTIDMIATKIVGQAVLKKLIAPQFLDTWIVDENIWLKRTALLHQLKFKTKTDKEKLFKYCDLSKSHNDFFIKKALGWVLREYSKTNPDAVAEYIDNNIETLSPLSIREGSKYL